MFVYIMQFVFFQGIPSSLTAQNKKFEWFKKQYSSVLSLKLEKNPKYFNWNQYWYFYQLKSKFVTLRLMLILTYDSDGNSDTWKIFPVHGKLVVWEIQETGSWGDGSKAFYHV